MIWDLCLTDLTLDSETAEFLSRRTFYWTFLPLYHKYRYRHSLLRWYKMCAFWHFWPGTIDLVAAVSLYLSELLRPAHRFISLTFTSYFVHVFPPGIGIECQPWARFGMVLIFDRRLWLPVLDQPRKHYMPLLLSIPPSLLVSHRCPIPPGSHLGWTRRVRYIPAGLD